MFAKKRTILPYSQQASQTPPNVGLLLASVVALVLLTIWCHVQTRRVQAGALAELQTMKVPTPNQEILSGNPSVVVYRAFLTLEEAGNIIRAGHAVSEQDPKTRGGGWALRLDPKDAVVERVAALTHFPPHFFDYEIYFCEQNAECVLPPTLGTHEATALLSLSRAEPDDARAAVAQLGVGTALGLGDVLVARHRRHDGSPVGEASQLSISLPAGSSEYSFVLVRVTVRGV